MICLCSDRAGMLAACEALEAIKAGKEVPGAIPQDNDGGARADRRAAFGFDPPARTVGMRPLATTPAHTQPVTLGPVLPVIGLTPIGGDVLATASGVPDRNIGFDWRGW